MAALSSFFTTYKPKGAPPSSDDKNVIAAIKDFPLQLHQGWFGMISDLWRQFQWGIIKSMSWLADNLVTTGSSILNFLTFYTYKPVVDFIDQFMPFVVLASFLFFAVAWIAAMSKKEIPIVDMIKSGAFSWFTFFILPILMIIATGFTQNLIEASSANNLPSASIIKNNVYDIHAIDQANWDKTELDKLKLDGYGAPNYISSEGNNNGDSNVKWDELDYIDPTETINGDKKNLSDFGQKVIDNKIKTGTYAGKDYDSHKSSLVKLDKGTGLGDLNDENYYTFSWNFWEIFLSLLASIIFSALLLYRMVRLETGIFLSWTIGNVVALTQWGTTKRNWEIITKLGMGFTTLLFTSCLISFFNFGIQFLSNLLQGGKINFVAFILLAFGFGMEMIDGPALWQQLFGIDAGIKSGWQSLISGVLLGGRLFQGKKNKNSNNGNGKNNHKDDPSPKSPESKSNDNPSPEGNGDSGFDGNNGNGGNGRTGSDGQPQSKDSANSSGDSDQSPPTSGDETNSGIPQPHQELSDKPEASAPDSPLESKITAAEEQAEESSSNGTPELNDPGNHHFDSPEENVASPAVKEKNESAPTSKRSLSSSPRPSVSSPERPNSPIIPERKSSTYNDPFEQELANYDYSAQTTDAYWRGLLDEE